MFIKNLDVNQEQHGMEHYVIARLDGPDSEIVVIKESTPVKLLPMPKLIVKAKKALWLL